MYTLETDEISGVFARDAEGQETRLFHTADFRARYLDAHPNGAEIALSVSHRSGMENLAVVKADGSDLVEVTDGESQDQAPRWAPGPGRRLVFQSSGMARDALGRFARFGPFAIQQLDLDTGEIESLAQSAEFDFLWPRIAADQTLYYIRRPNADAPPPPATPWSAFQQTVFVPFQILRVIGRLIALSVEQRTGSPLLPAKPAGAPAFQTPASWVLMRQTAAGMEKAEVLAENVRAFDLASDGSVLYSNGFEVYRMPADGGGATKVLSGEPIDCFAAL